MARISDPKTGKLTKQYRDPSVFNYSRRGRKSNPFKSTSRTTRRRTQNIGEIDNTVLILSGIILLVMIVGFIWFMISAINWLNSSNYEEQNVSASSPEIIESSSYVDLAAFEGECGVDASVEIEKEKTSYLLDVNIILTNTSSKNISSAILYLVKCYDDDTPIESWQYCDRLLFEDIDVNASSKERWLLGTTTQGAREYKVYVAYVLFEDGTSWGNETINHEEVIKRNVQVDVNFTSIESE